MRRRSQNNKKKTLLLTLAIILVIGGGSVYLWSRQRDTVNNTTQNETSENEGTGINLDPPTEEEQQAGDEQKVENDQETSNGNSENTQDVSVIITDAGQYDDVIEVRSFIPNHYEDGTCIIKFSQGTKVVTKDTPAYRDASTTICTNPLFERSEFPAAGDWQLTVSYKSSNANGQSAPQTVTLK